MFIQGLRYGSLPAHEMSLARRPAGLFLAGVTLLVIDLLSFGPFVSDCTRYLPAQTNGRRLFWDDLTPGTCWPPSCPAQSAPPSPRSCPLGPVAAIGRVSGPWALAVMAFSLVNAGTFNAYTGAFQVPAFGNMWHRFKSASVLVRLIPFCLAMAVGVAVALLGYRSFITNLSSFLDVLLVVLIPWSAVNLADYFIVRRARDDISAFFVPGSTYGNVSWRGLLAYAAGLAAEWPFVSQPDYTGSLGRVLGGADISWLVGWFVFAGVYLLVTLGASGTGRASHQVAAAAPGTGPA
jgi:nucleobase:cation symporter-1, NCS1 family